MTKFVNSKIILSNNKRGCVSQSPELADGFFTTSPLRGKEGNIKEQSLLFSIVVVFKYVQKFFITPLSNEWI